jgi:SAM-dependent methyltransferase
MPAALKGKTVLDIGCNAGFYAMEMKRRGADRVLGLDSRRGISRAGALRRRGQRARHRVPQDVGLRRRRSARKFDLVIFMGVLYHLRHPLLALDLIHEHVARDLLLFQSMQRGSDRPVERSSEITISGPPISSTARLSEAALHRAQICRRSDQLVGAEPRLRRSHAAQRRLRHRRHPERRSICRRGQAARRPMAPVYPVAGAAGDDRSGQDLERAEQQVALGPELDPGLDRFAEMAIARRQGHPRGSIRRCRACSAASRRSIRRFIAT